MSRLFLCFLGVVLLFNFSADAKNYKGAELYSTNLVKYGRFDIRMRTISGSGTISSFFLYYDDSYKGPPEPWREIDIEVLGKSDNVFQSNIITGNADNKTTSEELHTYNKLSEDYHTYTLEWTPDYIAWFFDGEEVRRSTDAQVTDCQLKEMSYRFNLWISDAPSWAGQFNPSILPVYQYINWIKYSKYTPGSGPNGTNFTPEWEDDFNSFDSRRWGKGDWTFDGNLVDFTGDNIVIKDGYCIICLTDNNKTGFSGKVPEDKGVSIKNDKQRIKKPFSTGYSNPVGSYLLTLDGRRLPFNLNLNERSKSGVWIKKEKDTFIPVLRIN
ncbi:MAG: family 16 glycosylhydrolase [Fibrobacter sp.]|jgi:endo-1,3-1,4-beta-glycanase ExoK|nr:family 16 glycosylhydrolase [Fibrobacter sp.]